MSLSPEAIDALVAAGATAEMLAAAFKAELAADQAKKSRQIPWPKLRAMAFERDGRCCQYCKDTDGPFEVDHIVPRSKGGEDTMENVCVSCSSCNRAKRDRDVDEWSSLHDRRQYEREKKRKQRAASRNNEGQPGTIGDPRGTIGDKERDAPLSRPPNEINSNPPTHTPGDITTRPRKAGPRPADFEAWWAVYPRKVEKVAARKAFERAWDLVDPPDKLATLIAAATAYAERTDPAFIKHPTTWLNKGCWSDETQETARILTYERPRPAQPSPGRDDRLDRMLSGLVAAVNGPGS